jgi:predicted TIM-barrel fold metal-dependent hydrolase
VGDSPGRGILVQVKFTWREAREEERRVARTEEKYMVAYIVNVRNAEIGSDVTRMDDFRSVRMSL